MGAWRFSASNLLSRAAVPMVAVSPAAADTVLGLGNLGSGYPDEPGGFAWRSDGTYSGDADLNMLLATSSRADAPTGWWDLPLYLAGTPGLPANPPAWGTFASRTALKVYGPTAQDVDVMPGETVKVSGSIHLPAASTATAVEVRVTDLTTGRQWDGGGSNWDDDGIIETQNVDDAWKDFSVSIVADVTHGERRTYRVSVRPVAATYDATTYAYISANGGSGSPALFASVDLCAIVGHNLPAGATVTLSPQPSGTAIALTPVQPSFFTVAATPIIAQTWRLSISIPSALMASSSRPILGELWIGSARSMLIGGPQVPIEVEETSARQIMVQVGARREIVADDSRAVGDYTLNFLAKSDAPFEEIRDAVMRLTRFGADPLLLLPDSSYDALPIHGRAEGRLAWSLLESVGPVDSARSFALPLHESPFASP